MPEPFVPRCRVIVHDLRRDGCVIAIDRELAPGTLMWIMVPGVGQVPARVMRALDDGYACSFIIALTEAPRSATTFDTTAEISGHGLAEPDFVAAGIRRWPLLIRGVFALALATALWALIISWF